MEGELFDSSTQQSFGVAMVTTRHINSTAKLVPPFDWAELCAYRLNSSWSPFG